MTAAIKYKQPDVVIGLTAIIAAILSYLLVWKYSSAGPVNFIDGDTEYYYYYLQSTFIDSSLIHYDWLTPGSGSYISHHPLGVSLLLTPFFLVAFVFAKVCSYPLDGLSAPFQVSIAIAAIFYAVVGLIYLKKLFRLNNIPDRTSALLIALVFFGTTLYHYVLIEGAMSHVYSFCFITVFLYHSCKFVRQEQNRNLLFAALAFGIILLLRPNNGLIVFSLFFWFSNKEQCLDFFKRLVKNRVFYYALLLVVSFILLQVLIWAVKEKQLFSNRYAPYGFYWAHPQLLKMLFGFDNGFFIYTPLCFLFLLGLIPLFKENRFFFFAVSAFLFGLFYFFSAYSAYTYFDGLSIRVLVDYSALFALLGAKLFTQLAATKAMYSLALATALFFVAVNVIYSYQDAHGILKRSGMTFRQWKYVFLKTAPVYQNCLGGDHDLKPYAKQQPENLLVAKADLAQPFEFSQNEFGLSVSFDNNIPASHRMMATIDCSRKELFANSSKDAMICLSLQNKDQKNKYYYQFKLNETPENTCCEERSYHYTVVMSTEFEPGDRLSAYIWNISKQPFLISEFSVNVYNYNYQIN